MCQSVARFHVLGGPGCSIRNQPQLRSKSRSAAWKLLVSFLFHREQLGHDYRMARLKFRGTISTNVVCISLHRNRGTMPWAGNMAQDKFAGRGGLRTEVIRDDSATFPIARWQGNLRLFIPDDSESFHIMKRIRVYALALVSFNEFVCVSARVLLSWIF